MGQTISFDKHVSNLDDILEISPTYYNKVKFENPISENITQHLKIWKFYEDHKKVDLIKTVPIQLGNIENSGFNFSSIEAYLILLIYKAKAEDKCELVNFPHTLLGIVESVTNLTPRGLLNSFSSSNENFVQEKLETFQVENLESLLLSHRNEQNCVFKYILFVWNGKNASSLVKALALTKGFELDTLLHNIKDTLLNILFSGGIIRHKKLQKGPIITFNDIIPSNMLMSSPSNQKTSLQRAYETVYLLQLWIPKKEINNENSVDNKQNKKLLKFPRFTHTMFAMTKNKSDYFSRFESIDDNDSDIKSLDESNKSSKFELIPNKKLSENSNSISIQQINSENPSKQSESDKSSPLNPNTGKGIITKSNEQATTLKLDINMSKVSPFGGKGISLNIAHLKTREEERQELAKESPMNILQNVNIRDTNRKEIESELFSKQSTPIIENFLFLGSDLVAQSLEILEENKITHIINCAADYSDNYFPGKFSYKTYFLKDSVRENIECCFYDAIEFINNAKIKNGRVFVHCIQGVSRSAAICIAYLIFERKMTCPIAFDYIQKLRPIANPNMMFNAQLFWWHIRLYQDYSSLPVKPRVFAISSHEKEQPYFIVARLLMEHLYEKSVNTKVLDPRGIFLIQTQEKIIVWEGKEIFENNKELYHKKAKEYISFLQKYEKGSSIIEYIYQGKEDSSFWSLWHLANEPTIKWDKIVEWEAWFADVLVAESERPKDKPLVYSMDKKFQDKKEEEEMEKIRENKPRLYNYPNFKEFQTVFDFADLEENALLLLCVKNKSKLYIWRGIDFENNKNVIEEFKKNVINNCWGNSQNSIDVCYLTQESESESFLDYFD